MAGRLSHSSPVWVLRDSVACGASPLYAKVTFSFFREPLLQGIMCAIQF